MRPALFTVEPFGPGRLSTMARPRGGDWLDDETAALVGAGVDVLVCTLVPDELVELGLRGEAASARAAGLRFTALPIPDRGVPDGGTARAVRAVLPGLAADLDAGAHVVVHCRAGIGRSSLVAATLMVLGGLDPDTAWARIERARGLAVPDTEEQRDWVRRLARTGLPGS